jgi:hypothetical protein
VTRKRGEHDLFFAWLDGLRVEVDRVGANFADRDPGFPRPQRADQFGALWLQQGWRSPLLAESFFATLKKGVAAPRHLAHVLQPAA